MPLISLNEAVTFLIGEPRRVPEREVARSIRAQNWMRDQSRICGAKLPKTKSGKVWLASLYRDELVGDGGKPRTPPACWPPCEFLEILGPPSIEWPRPIRRLHKAATLLVRLHEKYERKYAAGLAEILEAGRHGDVRFQGRLQKGDLTSTFGVEVGPIPRSHFDNNLTIDGDRRHLIPNRGRRGGLPLYQSAAYPSRRRDGVRIYYDVEVESVDVQKLLSIRSAAGQEPRRAVIGPAPEPGSNPNAGSCDQRHGFPTLVRNNETFIDLPESEIAQWFRENKPQLDEKKADTRDHIIALHAWSKEKHGGRVYQAKERLAEAKRKHPDLKGKRGPRPNSPY